MNKGFAMSSDMAPYRMIRRIPLSPPFFVPKNGERSRKASLHCAVRHNFTQKTKFFLHIFTKFQKPCLLVHRSLVRRWMKSLHFISLVKTFLYAPLVKFSRFLLRQGCGGQAASKDCVSFY